MSGNPKKDKLDPLHMKKTKHGIKIKKGELIIPQELYDQFRPEDIPKGMEKKVANYQGAFSASVLAAVDEDIVDAFDKNKKLDEIKGKVQMAYRGNNLAIKIAREKTFPMDGVKPKNAFATLTTTHSFKSHVKPIREHLAELARKRKI